MYISKWEILEAPHVPKECYAECLTGPLDVDLPVNRYRANTGLAWPLDVDLLANLCVGSRECCVVCLTGPLDVDYQ